MASILFETNDLSQDRRHSQPHGYHVVNAQRWSQFCRGFHINVNHSVRRSQGIVSLMSLALETASKLITAASCFSRNLNMHGARGCEILP